MDKNYTSCRKFASTVSLNIWSSRIFLHIGAIICRNCFYQT